MVHAPPVNRSSLALELDALRFEQKRRQLAVIMVVLVAPSLVHGVIDLFVVSREEVRFAALVALRVVAIALAALGILGIARLRDEARFERAAIAISYGIVALVIVAHLLRPAALSLPYFFEAVAIVALYAMLPSRGKHQLVPALLLTAAALVLLAVRHTSFVLAERVVIVTTLLMANALGATIAWHWH